MKSKPKVAIVLNSMWAIKDYMLSDTIRVLGRSFSLLVWAEKKFLPDVISLANESKLDDVEFTEYIDFKPNLLNRYAAKCQKSILYEYYDIQTEKVFQKRTAALSANQGRTRWQNLLSRILRLVAKSRYRNIIDTLLAHLRMSLIPYYLYFPDLKKYGVQLVMTTDPIRRTDDLLFVAAKKLYIPITTLVLSWDNLTSKGRINDGYDCVMAWNELMKQEILSMYPSYTNDTVKVVGYPRFDIYKKPLPSGFEREPFLKSLGLDPANRVLLYANAPIRSFPVQPQVIDHVYQAMMNGQLPQDTQLLIRCHPHDDLAIYDIFRNCPRVAVWPGKDRQRNKSLYNQFPDKDDLLILAASMKHSALCINPGSSVMLDAAICDIPIVCIAYDGDCIVPPESSYATCYEYSHQKPFHQIGATDICYSKEELIRYIQKALAHPDEKSAQRKIIVDRYLGGEGSSANRIRKVLMDLC